MSNEPIQPGVTRYTDHRQYACGKHHILSAIRDAMEAQMELIKAEYHAMTDEGQDTPYGTLLDEQIEYLADAISGLDIAIVAMESLKGLKEP
jgi:NAD(P)H-flavin reductase